MELLDVKTVCLVNCRRSPEPAYLKWKGIEKNPDGDLYVRRGPGSIPLKPEDVAPYIAMPFGRES